MLGSAILVEHGSFSRRPPLHLPKRLLNAAAFMMIGGRVLPSVRHKRAYRAYEPDIDRAAEGLSRAASAAIAGAADAGVRVRHRTRRRQLRRASLLPVWQWLTRDGAPEQAREFEAVLARVRQDETASDLEPAIRTLQLAAADAILKIASPGLGGDKQRALARVGPPDVIADLLPIALVLQAREALDTLGSRLPSYLRMFADQQIAVVSASLNVASLQTPQLLPFALSLVMQRLAAPWQIIRLAIKMAASDDEIRVAATPYGVAVSIALHDLSLLAVTLRSDLKRGHFDSVPGRVRRLLRQRADKDIGASARLDPGEVDETAALIDFVAVCRTYASELAINEVTLRTYSDLQQYVEKSTEALVQSLRGGDAKTRAYRETQVKAAVRFCEVLFGRDYASLMSRAAENALIGDRKPSKAG